MDIFSLFCRLALLLLGFCKCCSAITQSYVEGTDSPERYRIEGVVERPASAATSDKDWFANTRVYSSTGYVAFIRENGSFVFNNLPWGAHNIHVSSPSTAYASVRVDINSKGKLRIRKLDILQPSKVEVITGPLRLLPLGPVRYFQGREQWRLTDLLFNPMVLMTVVPLGLLLILPKFGDADTRKEMESQLQMPKTDTPDLSEFMTNLFKGNSSGGGGGSAIGGDARRAAVKGGPGGGGAAARGSRRKEK